MRLHLYSSLYNSLPDVPGGSQSLLRFRASLVPDQLLLAAPCQQGQAAAWLPGQKQGQVGWQCLLRCSGWLSQHPQSEQCSFGHPQGQYRSTGN